MNDLLSAVLADPFDDLPRLIYADWLEENGEHERAEFIRRQIDDPEADQWELLFDLAYVFFPDAEGEYCNQPKNTIKILHADKSKVEYVFRRGFVDEVRCSLLDWVGGVCPKSPLNPNVLRGAKCLPGCETCHRTGRVPGIAGRVCGQWPVTKVVLTDCEPARGDNRYTWWCLVQNRHGHQVIDRLIWEELKGYFEYGGGRPVLLKWYPSKELALTALSDAAIRYGRRLAGLGEINLTQPTSPPH